MDIETVPQVHWLHLPDHETLNARSLERFTALKDDPANRRSHFFHGRFENLYLDRERITEILPLIEAVELAAKAIVRPEESIRCGFWFNAMEPGNCTSTLGHIPTTLKPNTC